MLDLALDEAMRMVKSRSANFYFFDESGNLSSYHKGADSEESRKICEYCIKHHTSLNLISAEQAEDSSGELLNPRQLDLNITEPTICVYLGLQEGDFGAIILREPRYFEQFYEVDISLVKTFGATFSILLKNSWTDQSTSEIYLKFKSSLLLLLENANLIQKIKQSDHTLHTVLEVSNLINSSRELHEMIQAVLYSARKVIRAENASLFLMDEETGELYFDVIAGVDNTGLRGMRIPQGQGIAGQCALEKKSIIVNDAQNDPRLYKKVDEAAQNVTRNLIAAPLLINDITIGVIEVINTIDRPAFSDQDLGLFESFSDSVAIALHRRRIQDDLQDTNALLEQRLKEITCLHAVAAALVEAGSIELIFSEVLKIIRKSLEVGRVSVMLFNLKENRLEVVANDTDLEISNEPLSDEDLQERRLSEYVFQKNEPLFIEDIQEGEFREYASPGRYQTGSCILIPMSSAKESSPFGVLCVSESLSGKLTRNEYRMLITITSQLVRGYENIMLNEEILAKKAMEKEVEITSKIQQNILPSHKPKHLHLDLVAKSVMAKTTGGDFYDYYVQGEDGDVTLLVADVSGKSLPAALFMAVSSSILRTVTRSETEPTEILSRSNEILYEESQSGMFVTVFLARYNPMAGSLRYASAGHNEMIIMHADGSYELLAGKGSPLGVLPGQLQKYTGGELQIREGDLLVLYTDGVVEAVNSENQEYGLDKFIKLLQDNITRKPDEIISTVYDSVIEWSGTDLQYDDFTMLVTRFQDTIQGVKGYQTTFPAIVESIPQLRDYIMNICQRHGIDGYPLDDILLVSDEAATNIVLHAYKDINQDNPTFECYLQIENNKRVSLTFKDQGNPFSLSDVKSPDLQANLSGDRKGGFGVFLIQKLMDGVEYSRKEGSNYLYTEKSLE